MSDPSCVHAHPVNAEVEVVAAVDHKRSLGGETLNDGDPALQYFHQVTCSCGASLSGSILVLDNLLVHWHH